LLQVTDLNLSENLLVELPMELGELTALTVLDVSDNKLTQARHSPSPMAFWHAAAIL